MSMLLIPSEFNPIDWIKALQNEEPSLKIQVWPKVQAPEDVQFALVWWYPPGELLKFPNLKCIASIGAGVDFILNDTRRPDVPVVKIVDQLLTRDMTQFVLAAVLNHVRNFDEFRDNQKRHIWIPKRAPLQVTVGVMGLGQLGCDVATHMQRLGFNVIGWSRSAKQVEGIKNYVGKAQFNDFLAQSEVLVCLLPLTPETQNILNRETFSHLPKGAYVINAARGAHLVDADLIAALDNNHLSGACLDVFRVEPLPADHPFWQHPKIKITPHIASKTNPVSVAPQIIANYKHVLANEKLLNEVDVERGY